jgi:LmbE family N-acetylglucosaminyl deacetylase
MEKALPDCVVFLLPHQDDEFGVVFAIEQAVRQGKRPVCLYLTDGSIGGHDSSRRNDESRGVLRQIGVDNSDMHFIGAQEDFRDGLLYTRLDDALHARIGQKNKSTRAGAALRPPARI